MTDQPSTTMTDIDPNSWWRRLSWVTPRLAISGDLPAPDTAAQALLDQWRAAGVTTIVDLRGEHSDKHRVNEWAPELDYIWLGTHDTGGDQDVRWFIEGVEEVLGALSADPEAKVLVHCHMGVNRAPSMAYAVLLAQGVHHLEAISLIRNARPIAAALYAPQALDNHLWVRQVPDHDRDEAVDELVAWMSVNRVDVSWVISRIRRSGLDGI